MSSRLPNTFKWMFQLQIVTSTFIFFKLLSKPVYTRLGVK